VKQPFRKTFARIAIADTYLTIFLLLGISWARSFSSVCLFPYRKVPSTLSPWRQASIPKSVQHGLPSCSRKAHRAYGMLSNAGARFVLPYAGMLLPFILPVTCPAYCYTCRHNIHQMATWRTNFLVFYLCRPC